MSTRIGAQAGDAKTCDRCHKAIGVPRESVSTGYGTNDKGEIHCFACCGELDAQAMIETGKATLYLTMNGNTTVTLSNWPGTLKLRGGYPRVGRHNMAGKRYDVWFVGPDGKTWHGTQYGDNTQICHCKRVR